MNTLYYNLEWWGQETKENAAAVDYQQQQMCPDQPRIPGLIS